MLVFFAGFIIPRIPPGIDFGPGVGPAELGFFASIVWLFGIGMFAVAGLSAAAGIGVLYYENWGRVMALIVVSFLMFSFPIGTAVSIYGFWVLLSAEGRQHFRTHAPEFV